MKEGTYFKKNQDEIKQKRREYYLNNKDRIAEYRKTNKEHTTKTRKIYYEKHRDEILLKASEYYRTHGKKKVDTEKRWAERDRSVKRGSAYTAVWRNNNYEKYLIQRKTRRELKKGTIQKPDTCSVCGRNKRLNAHHVNYDSWKNYIWVCHSCHIKIHKGSLSSGNVPQCATTGWSICIGVISNCIARYMTIKYGENEGRFQKPRRG